MRNEILAYFITWSCYGTHLPGDEDGWTKWHQGLQQPQPLLRDWCREHLTEQPTVLSQQQRMAVEEAVSEVCKVRSWTLHAINCRTTHCHVVLTAMGYDGTLVRNQLKAWATRKLKQQQYSRREEPLREHWWTAKGSVRKLFDEESIRAAMTYTLDAQDLGGSRGR